MFLFVLSPSEASIIAFCKKNSQNFGYFKRNPYLCNEISIIITKSQHHIAMKIRLFLLFFLWYTCANAQVALMYDADGEIQMLQIKDVAETNDYQRQFSLTCTNRLNDSLITLTPEVYDGYMLSSRTVYASKKFEYAGETKRLFLRRVKVYQDSIYFYVYYDDESALNPIYYMDRNGNGEVYPLADDPEKGYISPLHALLLSYPMAEDPEVRAYFDKMEPTPRSFEERHQLALSKYASHLPRFKWGAMLGLASTKVKTDLYRMDQAISMVPGVFADIPILLDFSYHPELSFEKYAANGSHKSTGMDVYNDAAFNVTQLSTAQLFRYSSYNLPTRWVPFIEIGGQFSYKLKHSMEYSFIDQNTISYLTSTTFAEEHRGEEEIPATSFSFLAGVGIEWQFSRHHSLYLSGRFYKEFGNFGRIGGLLLISYNL